MGGIQKMAMITFGVCLVWWYLGHMSYKTAKEIGSINYEND